MKSKRRPAQELRAAIDSLPLVVRQAVLDGIKHRQRIIAGAHADEIGGVCPMVAADMSWREIDRAGVERAQEAALAWDRYADATAASHPATKRQLLALRAMLEASILAEPPAPSPTRVRRDTGERDRTRELRGRPGWSWLRPFRSYDEYEEALRTLWQLTDGEPADRGAADRELVVR